MEPTIGFVNCRGPLELADTARWGLSTSGLHDDFGFPPITMLRAHRPLSMDFLGTEGRVLRHEALSSSMFGQWLHGKHGPRMGRWVIERTRTHDW
jgi:hypothetical protein